MALRLSIVRGDVAGSDNQRSWTCEGSVGRIGRSGQSDWVLVDPGRFISSQHARVELEDGHWWVIDTSTNGTYVNLADEPLGKGGRHRLASGDTLRLGSLELAVEVLEDELARTGMHLPRFDLTASLSQELDLAEVALDQSVEVRALLENSMISPPLPGLEATLGLEDEPLLGAPAATAPAHADGGNEMAAFFRGVGIDPAKLDPAKRQAILREAGEAMREFMLGLMELSRMRADFTRDMGIAGSARERDLTSPLMHVRGVEDALLKMLTAGQAREAVDEIRSQFAKARHHQQAIMVAAREALSVLLSNLDPEELQSQMSGATRGAATQETQAKYWLMYKEMFQSLTEPGKEGLPAVFHESFVRFYQSMAKGGAAAVSRFDEE